MSYEKKIKDLMDRLASMSPEPPPYPEDTPMVRPETRPSPRPALVFATAAAVVALVALPLLLFTGEGDPIAVGSTTTTTGDVTTSSPATSTTLPGTTSTTPPPTTTTEPVIEPWSGVVYLHQPPENSFSNNPALVAVMVEAAHPDLSPDDPFTGALATIASQLPDGLTNSIPRDVSVLSTRLEGDILVAEMNEAFLDGAATPGLLSDFTMLNQLIYTLTHDEPERSVQFMVGDEPVGIFGTEGIELTTPVNRESFRDWLHLINLTEPIVETAGGYVVGGVANVFEATLAVAVLDADGNVTHEDFIMATCGTGCWGDFSTFIDAELITPGESSVRLFQYSAEDGSVVDAITIPIPADGVWRFTAGG